MLVDYASSSDEDEDYSRSTGMKRSDGPKDASNTGGALESGAKRRKVVPPLPERFHDLFTSNPKISDNSPVHEGRTRVLPHVDGLWPTHVYLEWMPTAQEGEVLGEILEGVRGSMGNGGGSASKKRQLLVVPKTAIKSLVRSDVGVRLPLHVSLSPTLMIPGDQKEQFKNKLARCIEEERNHHTLSPRLYFNTSKVFVVTNKIQSRAFIVLQLNDEGSNQVRLLC